LMASSTSRRKRGGDSRRRKDQYLPGKEGNSCTLRMGVVNPTGEKMSTVLKKRGGEDFRETGPLRGPTMGAKKNGHFTITEGSPAESEKKRKKAISKSSTIKTAYALLEGGEKGKRVSGLGKKCD